MAKKLNNTAALCIETGHHDRGICCLVEALQLSDQQNAPRQLSHKMNKDAFFVCQCRHCSLDECIVFSERTPLHQDTFDDGDCDDENSQSNSNNNHGYIHRRPIRITPQSMHENHNMGVTLSLIITFNLALAHHLSALKTFAIKNDASDAGIVGQASLRNRDKSKETFQKILHLYELAYRWQIELEEDRIHKQRLQELQREQGFSQGNEVPDSLQIDSSPVTSLRFNMIISNNLSQIHRLVHNHAKYQRCLEHLLATVMFVVVSDWAAGGGTTSSSSYGQGHRQSQRIGQQNYMDFEGFFRNVSSLIFRGHCAGAA